MKRTITTVTLVLTLILICGTINALTAQDGGNHQVTVTNATRGQVFSPAVAISHNDAFQLFRIGEAATAELAALAEDGMADGLINYISSLPSVLDYAVAAGPTPPGGSTTLPISLNRRFQYVTVVGMLVDTNDAFFGARTVRAYRRNVMVQAVAYDAGSEANSENCDYIPGPACGSPGERDEDGAEGYVHTHAGIHGLADLDPAIYDWRNPVAVIKISPITR